MKKGILIPVMIGILGCGGKSNNPIPVLLPSQSTLDLPLQNQVCTTGIIISDSISNISFQWEKSANTSDYTIVITNLVSNATLTQSTSTTTITLPLIRNTPYSWYIVSKSASTSNVAQSTTWKFYNSGPGVVTYAPFPAEIVLPTLGQFVNSNGGTIDLVWKGGSVNSQSVLVFDVYFGTNKNPLIYKSNVLTGTVTGIPVISKTTYYWKVITKDLLGNTSDSGLYQFTIN